ncbi:hypothetical protein BASA50_001272 [Batrachochytrium salamandrivorans]|uniref:FH2 domain-containing protein n=1 Tax=Batrachochytrium salamandrivorans TaxID=1357716 RepID=A0ABQ8EVN9_9FUNG|nr:hypothetical protein BASA61_010307 [Batrachochytrium salamandrivorans]KAH6587343.1 hypothetical protein BASA50_001272 [Batrachochytrium salamandrivorans]
MYFFYLLPFVVVASYAAALPQPAGLSEQYSNNVDVDLASGLEARSYQPVLDIREDLPTLMSLERRGNSGGPSGRNRGSGAPSPSPSPSPSTPLPPTLSSPILPPPTLFPQEATEILDSAFKRDDFSSANISSTIYKVGDGKVYIYKDGPKAGAAVGGPAGDMLAKYIRRIDYVDTALIRWMQIEFSNITDAIKLAMGEVEFSKISKNFFITLNALGSEVSKNERDAVMIISNIVKHINAPIQNIEAMNTLFELALNIRIQFVDKLRSRLEGVEIVKTLYGYLSNTIASIMKFSIDQQGLYVEIIKALETPPPK